MYGDHNTDPKAEQAEADAMFSQLRKRVEVVAEVGDTLPGWRATSKVLPALIGSIVAHTEGAREYIDYGITMAQAYLDVHAVWGDDDA